ncbi:MAG: ATP phosphoribosyltransferase regulatory subunit [Gammaproteobacteria bacterium]|nr:ATP phosphoribosyltransferase regulatory subunit [Gammaproteobacteria bacterium]MBT8133467.1 ATP phosphoribosyltransferase regulatory subunit [Gammaproteobacteria bacterium]NNJ49170.1 ATP phosphoribosyltransferase regulatory subunit [Gammaproteobacteria bacterium]
MTTKQHWILPEGIEEVLPEQAARLEAMRRLLLDLYATWGYELVMPPTIDFIESLLTGTGHDLDLQTFKLVDQMSGRTLGLRADMTPQVARIDVHQLRRDVPTRLCYMGTVLRTRPESIGDSRSPLQVGAELYGHAGVESEVEILGLMLQTFSALGIDDIYLDLGNVDIYRGLAEQAGLSSEIESQLFDMLQRKAVTEINTLLDSLDIDDKVKTMLAGLSSLNGDRSVIAHARELLADANDSVKLAIDYLEKTAELMWQRYGEIKVHFDLSELHGYHYKTGVVFAAFVPQLGQAIARGGRYDDIGKIFGRARAATGFSTDLKVLSQLASKHFTAAEKIFAPVDESPELKEKITQLRNDGNVVIQQLPDVEADAEAMGCSRRLCLVDGQWLVKD